jgi:rhodanese-related sulfurtransferase
MKHHACWAILSLCLCALASMPAHAETIPYDEISPADAYAMVTTMDNAFILDIRTAGEYFWVGHPGENDCGEGGDLRGKVFHLPYKVWRFDREAGRYILAVNPVFSRGIAKLFNPGDHVILMSRSGERSLEAVQRLADSENSGPFVWAEIRELFLYNMTEGFEGGEDECGYRTLDEGWKNGGLPYNNSPMGLWQHPRAGGTVVVQQPLETVDGPLDHDPADILEPRVERSPR